MTTLFHTDIVAGAAANAATFNAPLGELDQAISDMSGGATVPDARLREWTEASAYELTSLTYDATYTLALASAVVKWPDGSAGTFTTTTINTAFQAIDAYTITHTLSGLTVTQPLVTRNANGSITAKPALVVS